MLETLVVKILSGIVGAEVGALQAGGRGFESPHVHQQFHVARVAVWRRRHGNPASDDNLDPQQVGTDLLITALSGPEV